MPALPRACEATEDSQLRMKLARRLAALWTAQPGCIAVMVVGSVAEGSSDSASDLDMCIFWDSAPGREAMDAVKAQADSGDRILFLGDPADGGCVESYRVDGIKTDFAHSTVALWHAQTDDVLEKLNLDTPWQKGMSGTLSGSALYGSAVIEALQARLRPYPEALRLAMLGRYCRFTPLYALERMALKRSELLFGYQLLTEYETNILYSLCALNGVYHALEFKRLAGLVKQLAIAPGELASRLEAILRAEPARCARLVSTLILDTLDLVQEHCPAFNVAPVRTRFELVI